MKQPSFLARRTLGPPNYFFAAMAAAFVLGLIPYGVWQALKSNNNAIEAWLPERHAEARDLAWFREQFLGEQFIAVSWEGCTLGNAEQLKSLARRLRPSEQAGGKTVGDRTQLFAKILTGPEQIEQLMGPPASLSRAEAIERLEGVLVGPVARPSRAGLTSENTRATCLLAFLSKHAQGNSALMRAAMRTISQVATEECGVPGKAIRMGGPPVQDVAIGLAAEHSLTRWVPVTAALGLCLCYFCLRSWGLAAVTMSAAILSAGLSLAIVFYFGAFEVFALGRNAPNWGTTDAILLVMPVAVYAFSLAGALFVANYYRAARLEFGVDGAAESAVRQAWRPCLMAAAAMGVALAALAVSDIGPIRKFGVFSAIAVVSGVAILLVVMPVLLHRFPPDDGSADASATGSRRDQRPHWPNRMIELFLRHGGLTAALSAVALIGLGIGTLRLTVSGQPLALLNADGDAIRDYVWLEQNVGNMMPVELVLTVPPERLRGVEESAEEDGQQYRMTFAERLQLVREVHARVEAVEGVSGALSGASFLPPAFGAAAAVADEADSSEQLEPYREMLIAGDCLQMERIAPSGELTGRELWRITARVAALDDDLAAGVDYDAVMDSFRNAVDSVLLAYGQRDEIVRQLSARGKRLGGSRLAVLFSGKAGATVPAEGSAELALGQLLARNSATPVEVTYFNTSRSPISDALDGNSMPDGAIETPAGLPREDAVVLLSNDAAASSRLALAGLRVIDVSRLPMVAESAAVNVVAMPGPRSIQAAYTGMAPLMEGTQRDVASGLASALGWAAVLVTCVLMVAIWNPLGALLAMIPVILPVAVTFGAIGWIGETVDLGTVLAASVGVGASLAGTVHYLTWFRRASRVGFGRKEAALIAHDRSAAPVLQTAIVAGLGMSALTLSSFAPLQQLGYLAVAELAVVMICQVALLPAMAAGPLGRFFGGAAVSGIDESLAEETDIVPRSIELEHEFARPRAAAATSLRVDAGGRSHAAPLEERREAAEEPHSSLHERLKRLRRRTGDSPSS